MSLQPIIEVLSMIDEEINQEEARIIVYLARINQLKSNFMLNAKNKTFAINILKRRISSSKEKITDLKSRRAIISTI